jgi:hypothetical protein
MTRRESVRIIGDIRFGNTKDLLNYIGPKYLDYLVRKGFIYQGKLHPEVWKITEAGLFRYRSIKSKFPRFIAKLIWRLNT